MAILNLFRGRDTLPITSAMNQMLVTSMLIPLPFYMWPGMNLLSHPEGMAPLDLHAWIHTRFGLCHLSRQRQAMVTRIHNDCNSVWGCSSYPLHSAGRGSYAGWDILFTGGFYFSKNKVFSTIGEAQAPDRGILFASFGPIVAIAAIGYGLILMWRGGQEREQCFVLARGMHQSHRTCLGLLADSYSMQARPWQS